MGNISPAYKTDQRRPSKATTLAAAIIDRLASMSPPLSASDHTMTIDIESRFVKSASRGSGEVTGLLRALNLFGNRVSL